MAQGLSASRSTNRRRNNKKSSMRQQLWLLVLTFALVAGSVWAFMPPEKQINQGLDIQGGLSVVLTAHNNNNEAITSEDMEKSRAVIENRVNALGASEAVVQIQGNNQILVQIPGMSDTQKALATIGKTGQLEFVRLDAIADERIRQEIAAGNYAKQGQITDEFGRPFPSDKEQHLKVDRSLYEPILTGADLTRVNISQPEHSAQYSVDLSLNDKGTAAFAKATKELAPTKGQIVIILDGEVQSAPAVQNEIGNGQVQITGNYTIQEAKDLQTILESGSLPVSFEFAQAQTVGPTLGQDALHSGVLVAGIGLLLVILYLLFFYKGLGIIAALAMAVFAVLYLGILALLSRAGLFSLSLAGIAGIVLTIGMAADSSILTLERFREEIRMGRSVRAASISGVRHAILTSIDADLVTLVSAITLFVLAAASVKGFGLTLALGIACDIVMMLIFKAPLIRLLAPKCIKRHPQLWGIQSSLDAAEEYKELLTNTKDEDALNAEAGAGLTIPEIGVDRSSAAAASVAGNTEKLSGTEGLKGAEELKVRKKRGGLFMRHDINFLGARKVLLSLSALLVVLSLVVVGVKGLQFGIEFVGGTSITFHNTGSVSLDQMRKAFDKAGEKDAVIQTTSTDGAEGFLIRTTTTKPDVAAAHADEVVADLGLTKDSFEVTTIGPDWGQSVINASLMAFGVSLVLIILYITARFRDYKMGVTAIISLLHDMILVMGVYALAGKEVNPSAIAALLTILGYSLYDTVVVFHRINDNVKESDIKCTFMTMANHSINQVFVRTINTTLSSLIPVVAMLFFGGATLQDFAFAMTIGLVAGSYSSIAVATPLYALWKTREPKFARLVKKYGTDVVCFEFAHPSVQSVVAHTAKESKADKKALKSERKQSRKKRGGRSAR